jgi:hypothetical protein
MFCWPCCHLGIILVNNQLDAQLFFYMFISILYLFRATSCSSSGESIVSIKHMMYVTLCKWPSSVQVGKEMQRLPDLHTRRSPTQSDTYQMYWYKWFSWWWARGCSKQVENWNEQRRTGGEISQTIHMPSWRVYRWHVIYTNREPTDVINDKRNALHIFLCNSLWIRELGIQ